MRPYVRAFLVISALHLGASAGSALAQSADVQEPAPAKKPDAAKKAADSKKKPAEVYSSAEIYQSSPTFLGTKLAVGGYDAVAYHTQNKPALGTDEFTHMWKGATWRFASKENLDAFVKEPEKYAPQYGGYCAFAVGHGSLASGDPKIWKIVNGKLYLNLNQSVQKSWERDIPGLTKRADANWPKVLK
jgi:YHS domain-containing protein